MAITILLQQSSNCVATLNFGRCQSSQVNPRTISQLKHDHSSVPKHRMLQLRDLNTGFIVLRTSRNMKNVAVVHASEPPEAPLPAHPSPPHHRAPFSSWNVQKLGTIVAILLSFSRIWLELLKLKERVEKAIMQVEQISFAVEKAAEMVEGMAEAAANRLPQGKFHDAAEFIEKLAEEIDKVAHLSVDLLEKMKLKVEETGKKVDSFLDSATRGKKADVGGEAKDQK